MPALGLSQEGGSSFLTIQDRPFVNRPRERLDGIFRKPARRLPLSRLRLCPDAVSPAPVLQPPRPPQGRRRKRRAGVHAAGLRE
jgi:hypothetical protein